MAQARAELAGTILAEMFLGLGKEATADRIAYYLRLLDEFEPAILRLACDAAVLARSDDWVPGPGEIRRHAQRVIGKRREADRERLRAEQRKQVRELVAGERQMLTAAPR